MPRHEHFRTRCALCFFLSTGSRQPSHWHFDRSSVLLVYVVSISLSPVVSNEQGAGGGESAEAVASGRVRWFLDSEGLRRGSLKNRGAVARSPAGLPCSTQGFASIPLARRGRQSPPDSPGRFVGRLGSADCLGGDSAEGDVADEACDDAVFASSGDEAESAVAAQALVPHRLVARWPHSCLVRRPAGELGSTMGVWRVCVR